MAIINEIGNTYGLLTVVSRAENDKNGKARWVCKCECGNEITVLGSALRRGNTKTCGCRRLSAEQEEIGKRYGSLTVESCAGRTEAKKILWNCKCDCGNTTVVTTGHLHSGVVKTCGQHFGGKNIIDETGKTYGKLTVISRADKPFNAQGTSGYWNCRCECGNNTIVLGTNLRTGRTLSCGCLSSVGEYNIIQLLSNHGISFLSQYSFPDLVYKAPLRYDFAILDEERRVVRLIEFDGPQHQLGNQWNTVEGNIRDSIKNHYAISNNIPLIRIPYHKRDNITIEDILTDKYRMRELAMEQ